MLSAYLQYLIRSLKYPYVISTIIVIDEETEA